MRPILPILTCISLLLPAPLLADNYSCTDSQGVIHIADNLMKLPAECRDQAKTLKEGDSGRVNYVAPVPTPQGQAQDFQQAVRSEELELKKKKQEAAEMVNQAKKLADNFEEAVTIRKTALRSKSYGSRDKLKMAESMMEYSRKGKRGLLEDMQKAHLSSEQRQQIMEALSRIAD